MRRALFVGIVGITLLGGCQQDDAVSAACRDLATETAEAAMAHGAAVRGQPLEMKNWRKVDEAYARFDSLRGRYTNAGCPKEYLRRTIRNAYTDRNDKGVPATERPTDIPSGT